MTSIQDIDSCYSLMSVSRMTENELYEEIGELEQKLSQVGQPGNDLYKRAVANVYRGLICVCKDQLSIIKSAEAA